MKFFKYNALGNDFVLIDSAYGTACEELSKQICRVKSGVGADGLLVFDGVSKKLEIFNSDGSRAAMCGNGARCVALHCLRMYGIVPTTIYTDAGAIEIEFRSRIPFACRVRLGRLKFAEDCTLLSRAEEVAGRTAHVTAVDTGVPHLVVFDGSVSDAEKLWRAFGSNFNVDWVEEGDGMLKIVTYERGAGRTAACGTGAAAAFAAAKRRGFAGDATEVRSEGGSLLVGLSEEKIFLEGGADFVFEGDFPTVCPKFKKGVSG